MAYILQQAVNGVPLAALYALLAFAYSMAFAVTRRADITIGALFAFSGQIFALFFFIAWQRYWLVLELCLVIGAAAAFLYTGFAATLIGRDVLRPLGRSEPHAIIVGGFAVMIVLMEIARLASETRSIWLPPLLKTPVTIVVVDGFAVTLTQMQMLNVGLMLGALAMLALWLARGVWGRRWKAVRDDPLAAELMGVDSQSVFVQAYVGAALIATFAGLLMTAYYGTMDFGAGLMFGLKVVMLGALGGYASPLKSAAGGAILGFAETMWTAFGPLALRDIVMFSALVYILVMTRREQLAP
ncbi:MAG TPA: branched-chain amino acid ABC transporter permease [Ensifer sp.]|nr:branched-chain amino acid ABC transporter permease [Ensifer sp.]